VYGRSTGSLCSDIDGSRVFHQTSMWNGTTISPLPGLLPVHHWPAVAVGGFFCLGDWHCWWDCLVSVEPSTKVSWLDCVVCIVRYSGYHLASTIYNRYWNASADPAAADSPRCCSVKWCRWQLWASRRCDATCEKHAGALRHWKDTWRRR